MGNKNIFKLSFCLTFSFSVMYGMQENRPIGVVKEIGYDEMLMGAVKEVRNVEKESENIRRLLLSSLRERLKEITSLSGVYNIVFEEIKQCAEQDLITGVIKQRKKVLKKKVEIAGAIISLEKPSWSASLICEEIKKDDVPARLEYNRLVFSPPLAK